MRQRGERQFSDERILGCGEFVKEVIDEAEESIKDRLPSHSGLGEAMDILEQKCQEAGISLIAMKSGSHRHECTQLRKELARQFVLDLGLSYAETARILGISASAVNQIFRRSIWFVHSVMSVPYTSDNNTSLLYRNLLWLFK